MRKYWYRRILIMIVTFLIAVAGGYYLIEFQQNRLEAEVNAATSSENMVIPGGMPIGIYLETEGVMVLGRIPSRRRMGWITNRQRTW